MSVETKKYFNGGSGGQGQKQTLVSPNNTIDVQETQTGHEIEVAQSMIDIINNKQDKIVVGSFQTNSILSMSLLERTNAQAAITNRVLGNYVPLIEIQCVNNGKSQFEFSIFSREDSMNYYGRYLLTTWNGSNTTCKFELIDYCNDNNNNVFNATNIVAIKLNPKKNNSYARYLICKKIISTNGVLDAYFVNILSQDLGFCYSKKYYTRSKQDYYNQLECIKIDKSVTEWTWYFDYNVANWNDYPGNAGLQKEYEYLLKLRKEVKAKGLKAFKANFWKCVGAVVLVGIIAGGISSYRGGINYNYNLNNRNAVIRETVEDDNATIASLESDLDEMTEVIDNEGITSLESDFNDMTEVIDKYIDNSITPRSYNECMNNINKFVSKK